MEDSSIKGAFVEETYAGAPVGQPEFKASSNDLPTPLPDRAAQWTPQGETAMKIGCPKEIKPQEFRVGMTPDAAARPSPMAMR
jgi:hypothetical protein